MRLLKNTLKGEMPVTRFIAGITAACAAWDHTQENAILSAHSYA